MSDILLRIHSLLPYLFLVMILLSVASAISTLNSGKFGRRHLALARITMILAHVQLLFGFLLLFFSDFVGAATHSGMGAIMKDSELRMRIVEHPLMMIIAIAFFTIGYSRAKRADTAMKKSRNILIFYGIALLLVLSRIPYANWFNL